MKAMSWLPGWLSRPRPRRRPVRSYSPRLEPLERREVLSGYSIALATGGFAVADTLPDAVAFTNASPGRDVIVANTPASLEYLETPIEILDDLTIRGNNLTVDGQGLTRLFKIEEVDVELWNLTLQNGNGTNPDGVAGPGGAISIDRGSLTLNSVTARNNSASEKNGRGGAIFASDASVTITGGLFLDNETSGKFGYGGAIFVENADLTLDDVSFRRNSTTGEDSMGGAVYVEYGAASIHGGRFEGNWTSGGDSDGGALAFVQSNPVSMTNVIITGNHTSGASASGGGLYFASGTLQITDSVIDRNFTQGWKSEGGGLYVRNSETTLFRTAIRGNHTEADSAAGGGGSFNFGNTHLIEVEVRGNRTEGRLSPGGGIRANLASGSTCALISSFSIYADNSTLGEYSGGGAISAEWGELLMEFTILANNTTAEIESGGGAIRVEHGHFAERATRVLAPNRVAPGSFGNDVRLIDSTYSITSRLDYYET